MFMASPTGRTLRVIVGLALIAWGWSIHERPTGIVLMVIGLAPLLAGVFNVCLISPILGVPFSGKDAQRTPGYDSIRR
jgi:hypothetical protein